MRVVDLRPGRRSRPPELRIWASPAAELVRATAALTSSACDGFDIGDERLAELTERLAPELRERLAAEDPTCWLFVSGLVALLPEPGTIEDLFALLEDEPALVWRTLLTAPLDAHEAFDGSLVDRYLAGDASVEELVEHVEELDVAHPLQEQLPFDLREEPNQLGPRLRSLLADVHAGVGAAMVAEAAGPMEREAAARRRELADGRHVSELVVDATNGYELTEDLPTDEVLLLPSYWFRPWLIINRIGTTEVLTSPVADEHIALPSAAPPPSLVKVCKALGDDGRLRLLRRMGGGPITLADAMDELDVAKTTAHHHLSILRQAGLVVIRGEGRDSRYAVRTHAPSAVSSALEQYLGGSTATARASG